MEQAKEEAGKLGKTKVTKAAVKKSRENADGDNQGDEEGKKKSAAKTPKLGKKVVTAMTSSFNTLYHRVKDIEISPDSDEVTVTLTREELEHLMAVGKQLDEIAPAEQPETPVDENQLHLIDHPTDAEGDVTEGTEATSPKPTMNKQQEAEPA